MAKDVATTKTAVPDYFEDQSVVPEGRGVSTDRKDILIPRINILQALSPQVEKKGVDYVPGAEPGMGFMKGAPNPLIDMDKGILFQPVEQSTVYLEWVPRDSGGGLAAVYSTMPAFARKEAPNSMRMINPENGNFIAETVQVGGYIIDESGKLPPRPAYIPFTSASLKVAASWNMRRLEKYHPKTKLRLDAWWVYYRIKTKMTENNKGKWYIFDITDAGEIDPVTKYPKTRYAPSQEDLERGSNLYQSIADKKLEYDKSGLDDHIVDDGKI